MTLLEGLQSHRGGLLRIKSELYWYGGRGFDGSPGRVCLILDVDEALAVAVATAATATAAAAWTRARRRDAAFLLIDGFPHWVWVAQEDVELIT